ncbi:MAG TPA: NYN domain-containing protein [Candidatus Kapabacteria bacterium]|nr:NYN domain-containing protein [Candidatus Kapabacteria bacterium]
MSRPLVRILVDGYSLLHAWPDLARGKARHSAAARVELIQQLRLYGDSIATPVTVVFDGAGPAPSVAVEAPSTRTMEIIYSQTGQTADNIIERVTAKLVQYGEVLVVSNDIAERDTVLAVGGNVCSCDSFISMIKGSLTEFERELQRYNRTELKRYRKG